ncbi:MAG: hypothetical protein ABL933_04405 [Methyloglobulus sp.]|nr:hypothetical protein [Methyloglobulus sp.]
MISNEDRAKIVERIRAENEIRKELAESEDGKKNRCSWLESKFSLLIIGAILTGVLIPTFQATQETIKWSRQNRYDNLKYRLDSARVAMKELTITHAFVAEAFERVKIVGLDDSGNSSAIKQYMTQTVEMDNRRFRQNALFVGALGLIDEKDRDVIQDSFNEYLSSVQQLLFVCEAIAEKKLIYKTSRDKDEENLQKAQASLSKGADKLYEQTLLMLKNYLHRLEVQSEKYF